MYSSEIQVIPYNHIVHQFDLNPGKIVEVQKPNSVDDFFQHISALMNGKPYCGVRIVNSEFPHSRVASHYPTLEAIIAESARIRHKHFGRLGNSTILALLTDPSWMPKTVPIQLDDLRQEEAANFLIATEMYTSSQSGSIGLVINEALVCFDRIGQESWVKMRAPSVTKILADIEDGGNGYFQALQVGLQQIYPKGLPSFGRGR